MAIPKKGSRLITVDGIAYRWRVRRKPTYCQGSGWGPLTFAVELADAPGRVFLVSLPCSRLDAWLGERTMAIRPMLVIATIRRALNHGWDPRQTGNAFTLNLTEDDLTDVVNGRPPAYEVPFITPSSAQLTHGGSPTRDRGSRFTSTRSTARNE